ncbi:unnamed protein product [Paramecium sonneborni]|uniref:Uncharacterized protein n=1 Tax=Paramecium sonneborni TaxID=65129 RepID=A0A8S1PRC8_9CILI|nr:unnamed protein product [Paramecium sonneborni]
MLKNLQKDLQLLSIQNQNQGVQNQIKGFFIESLNSQNLLHKVRPEVFNQILQFVEFKSYLGFRLAAKEPIKLQFK